MTYPDTREISRAAHRLTAVLDRATRARRGLPEPQVLLTAPGFEFAYGARAQRFEAASVGKVMTATLAFQLAEQGRLDLDAPVTGLLPRSDWDGLFVTEGVDHAAEVTLAKLLSHTSGVADYFEGRARGTAPFIKSFVAEPDRLFTPSDLLDFSRQHQQPVAKPGTRFSYSDTGFVLAARAIEEAGGASLAGQLHARIFGPVGMDDSCLLFHSMPGGRASSATPAEDLDLAPLWLGRTDDPRNELSRARSLSCDWGGGGVVSTVDDLVRFSVAWHGGDLVSEASLRRMTHATHRFRPGIRYGTGAMRLRYGGFSPFLAGLPRLTGHLGVTGAHLFGDAGSGIHLAMNFHSTREMYRSFRTHISGVQTALRVSR